MNYRTAQAGIVALLFGWASFNTAIAVSRTTPGPGSGTLSTTHFVSVNPTGRSQPVYITAASLDDTSLQPGDEIGIYDETLCVGAGVVSAFPAADPVVVNLVYTPPAEVPLPGAVDGHTMIFRIWDQSEDREIVATAEVVTGAAVFSEGAIVAVDLSAVSDSFAGDAEQRPSVTDCALMQNYPNPFNCNTTIEFTTSSEGEASLSIFTARGRIIRQLIHDSLPAGRHAFVWDGCDEYGKQVSSGLFLYMLKHRDSITIRRMILVK